MLISYQEARVCTARWNGQVRWAAGHYYHQRRVCAFNVRESFVLQDYATQVSAARHDGAEVKISI